MTNDANPTGIVLTPEQRERSYKESYWYNAIRYALEYYVAGRFAVHAQVLVSPNLLHHAVELLIKANLSRDDTSEQIRQYGWKSSYGHSLASAWQELKRRAADPALEAFDAAVTELDKFEDIRYPDRLVDTGAAISIGLVETPPPTGSARPERHYSLALPQIDRLVKLLFDRSGINPEVFRQMFEQKHAAPYFTLHNDSPLVVPRPPAPRVSLLRRMWAALQRGWARVLAWWCS